MVPVRSDARFPSHVLSDRLHERQGRARVHVSGRNQASKEWVGSAAWVDPATGASFLSPGGRPWRALRPTDPHRRNMRVPKGHSSQGFLVLPLTWGCSLAS
ncbi:hypothetical protein D187_009250 [Cystobacter fuscus DSM 2262]|uniref:Uncharacterized protein n=1 Tax=Cystobacter fuscus (strain ATCC 25194 / DSM 2262 / NBRC 100088 / M29) TaxID=1242864 RepID=S9Q2X8_CYSF2|nr:hypothetical protein D187_009250 [Cystobacter fuscus DSM 2262]